MPHYPLVIKGTLEPCCGREALAELSQGGWNQERPAGQHGVSVFVEDDWWEESSLLLLRGVDLCLRPLRLLVRPLLWRNNVPVCALRCRLREYLRNSLATRIGKLCRPAISRAIQSWLCVSCGWALSDDSLRSAGEFQTIRNRPRISWLTVWSSNYELDGHGFGVYHCHHMARGFHTHFMC